jgi:hypothetical protein
MAVEIYHGSQLQRIAVWCSRCIADAEHRSQHSEARQNTACPPAVLTTPSTHLPASEESSLEREELFVQEHLQLMDRAMREDDAVLVPLIEDFIQRCHAYHAQLHTSKPAQRLQGHLQYWDAFLKALRQSL